MIKIYHKEKYYYCNYLKVDHYKHKSLFCIYSKFYNNPYLRSHDIMRAMTYVGQEKSGILISVIQIFHKSLISF